MYPLKVLHAISSDLVSVKKDLLVVGHFLPSAVSQVVEGDPKHATYAKVPHNDRGIVATKFFTQSDLTRLNSLQETHKEICIKPDVCCRTCLKLLSWKLIDI